MSKRSGIARGTAAALAMLGLATGSAVAAQAYKDPAQPAERRAADLVSRMTLEEKAVQLQNGAPAIPRLGVPAYDYWNEALHGVARAGEATMFPQAIGLAATWDKQLLGAIGEVVATEGRAKYNQAQREGNHGRYFGLTFWSPNINIFRDPRWGRGQETLGEDPYLTGLLASAFITGVQGEDSRYYKAIATPKHLAVHSGPEPLRHGFNVDPSPRDLAETYLPAFRRTLVEAKAASLMCAYNAVYGKPACASPELLRQLVREDWGFKGFIVSDCGAIDDITTGHKQTRTNVEAVAAAIKAGTDLACTFRDEYLDIPKAVAVGLLTESDVDRALSRVLWGRIRLGLFDPPSIVPFSAIPYSANHAPEHRALALRAAREAIVLLKNDGFLPLARQERKIAVVGPGATSLISLEGNYNGTPTAAVLPLDGMAAAYGAGNIRYAQGSEFVAGLAVSVPRTAFKGGLKSTFYNGTDMKGPPVATRLDPELDHNWNWVAPAPGVDPKSFSVRWTGAIVPAGVGEHSFEFQRRRCDAKATVERYRIEIEGAPPLEVDGACGSRDAAEAPALKVRFADTSPRRIAIDYAHAAPSYAPAVTFAWNAPDEALRAEAVAAARQSDVVVAFVGQNAWLEGEEMPVKVEGFEGGDRTDIRLPAAQRDLLRALRATGKPLVLVLQSGSAVALGEDAEGARAVLSAWYGGEQGGPAIADVLTGAYNPSGRLPVTFYASTAQLPPFEDYAMAGRTYRYFEGRPEYAFGHGLSYTSFAYSRPRVGQARLKGGSQTVTVRVRNTGQKEGEEVVQLYLTVPAAAGMPLRSLRGFERARLAPGEEKEVRFTLGSRDLAFADESGTMRVRSGRYGLWLGSGQPGTGAPGTEASFAVHGSMALPR